jgi:pyruvate dehydrogenase E1 component beta subunit
MSRILRPATRLALNSRAAALKTSATTPTLAQTSRALARPVYFGGSSQLRSYADGNGTKEYTVREALNEALAE